RGNAAHGARCWRINRQCQSRPNRDLASVAADIRFYKAGPADAVDFLGGKTNYLRRQRTGASASASRLRGSLPDNSRTAGVSPGFETGKSGDPGQSLSISSRPGERRRFLPPGLRWATFVFLPPPATIVENLSERSDLRIGEAE